MLDGAIGGGDYSSYLPEDGSAPPQYLTCAHLRLSNADAYKLYADWCRLT